MRKWSRARELVARIAAGEVSGPDGYELLQQVYKGFPLGELQPLVRSGDVGTVRLAAGILAEAGSASVEVPEFINEMLDHTDAKVRYYGVQTVLGSGSPILARQTAKSVLLLGDVEPPVRRSALRLLAHGSTDQLLAAIPFLDRGWGVRIASLLGAAQPPELVAHPEGGWNDLQVFALFDVAAAIRNARVDPRPLQYLALHGDPEIRELAQLELEQVGRLRD